MSRRIPTQPLAFLLVALGSAAGGAYTYHRYRDADWERRENEYQRQLQGKLTESEKQMQALNTELGTARAHLVTQATLDEKYQALLTAKDADFEQFRREHALALESLSNATFQLQQREHGGKETAREVPPSTPPAGEPTAPSAHPVIAYEYTDPEGRVQLKDPNIWVQGDEELQLQQLFRVQGTVLQQTNGSLMTERVQLHLRHLHPVPEWAQAGARAGRRRPPPQWQCPGADGPLPAPGLGGPGQEGEILSGGGSGRDGAQLVRLLDQSACRAAGRCPVRSCLSTLKGLPSAGLGASAGRPPGWWGGCATCWPME
jgi:hypothetical protein